MASDVMDRVVKLAAIGEAVVELIRESGVLRKKPGRKKGGPKRKYTKRAKPVADAKPKLPKAAKSGNSVQGPRALKPAKPKPPPVAEEPEMEVDEEEE